MKIIEVLVDTSSIEQIVKIAQHFELFYSLGSNETEKYQAVRILVSTEKRQQLLDALQGALGSSPDARIIIIPVEAVLPRPEEESEETAESKTMATREELYNNIEKGARLDSTYFALVFLSTIVAAIGLLEDNVAVVIGAMVIAPLLGPNIALALASALGDRELAGRSLRTGISGLFLAFLISVVIGVLWPLDINSHEIISRTGVGLDSLALALASGAAAVLSLTTGLSSVLVGVMVAVALLPPTVTIGLMLGNGQPGLAIGACLLLVANIVCVNLSAKLVFLIKGVKPRTWLEKKKAKQSTTAFILFWVLSLLIIVTIILLGDTSL
jgi:uncharacterized hydrophobic protein (TIGR00341 family)